MNHHRMTRDRQTILLLVRSPSVSPQGEMRQKANCASLPAERTAFRCLGICQNDAWEQQMTCSSVLRQSSKCRLLRSLDHQARGSFVLLGPLSCSGSRVLAQTFKQTDAAKIRKPAGSSQSSANGASYRLPLLP